MSKNSGMSHFLLLALPSKGGTIGICLPNRIHWNGLMPTFEWAHLAMHGLGIPYIPPLLVSGPILFFHPTMSSIPYSTKLSRGEFKFLLRCLWWQKPHYSPDCPFCLQLKLCFCLKHQNSFCILGSQEMEGNPPFQWWPFRYLKQHSLLCLLTSSQYTAQSLPHLIRWNGFLNHVISPTRS